MPRPSVLLAGAVLLTLFATAAAYRGRRQAQLASTDDGERFAVNANSASDPKLSIGFAQLQAAAFDRPACLKPSNAGAVAPTDAQKPGAVAFKSIAKLYQSKIHHAVRLVLNVVHVTSSDGIPVMIEHPYACQGVSHFDTRLDDEVNAAQLKALKDLLALNKSLGKAVTASEAVDACAAPGLTGANAVSQVADPALLSKPIETLATWLETYITDAVEKRLFEHLDDVWANKLQYAHASKCHDNWVTASEGHQTSKEAVLDVRGWRMWCSVFEARKCYGAWSADLAATAKELRAIAADAEEYGNWALLLCVRPTTALADCAAEVAKNAELKAHMEAHYGVPTEAQSKFFVEAEAAEAAAAAAAADPAFMAATKAAVDSVSLDGDRSKMLREAPPSTGVPGKKTPVPVMPLYNAGYRDKCNAMLKDDAPDADGSIEVNWVKFRALLGQVSHDWAKKDAVAARAWGTLATKTKDKTLRESAVLDWAKANGREDGKKCADTTGKGKAGYCSLGGTPEDCTSFCYGQGDKKNSEAFCKTVCKYWADPKLAAAGRRRQAASYAKRVVGASFWSASERAAARGADAVAALKFVADKEAERKKAVDALADKTVPAVLGCEWRPRPGSTGKGAVAGDYDGAAAKRTTDYIDFVTSVTETTPFRSLAVLVAPCEPSDALLASSCTATGEVKGH